MSNWCVVINVCTYLVICDVRHSNPNPNPNPNSNPNTVEEKMLFWGIFLYFYCEKPSLLLFPLLLLLLLLQ